MLVNMTGHVLSWKDDSTSSLASFTVSSQKSNTQMLASQNWKKEKYSISTWKNEMNWKTGSE